MSKDDLKQTLGVMAIIGATALAQTEVVGERRIIKPVKTARTRQEKRKRKRSRMAKESRRRNRH